MTAGDKYAQALEQLFHRKPVATVDDLRRALDVKSRTTVLKALQTAGYLSSYTHAGQFYTLKRIPTFDAQGLWFYDNVRFSVHETLRATVVYLVRHAPAGYTHDELRVCLGLRVHDTLRSLVQSKLIARESIAALYVYVDADLEVAAVQLARRKRKGSPPPLDPARTIEVLVAVIHEPKAEPQAIATRLKVRGVEITQEQVESVFAKYALKKTAPSRS